MKMKKKRIYKGALCIAAGALLLLMAAALTTYNLWDQKRAGQAAQGVLEELMAVQTPGSTADAAGGVPDYVLHPEKPMPVWEVNSMAYIGILSIPSLELTLPVMDSWSYAQLKTAPCRYAGSVYSGDLVLCAHNYDAHFGRIDSLQPGDRVTFTDAEGNCFEYEVAEREILAPAPVQAMTEEGDWDLTLFTCTLGGQQRVTVRCVQK